MVGAGGRQWRYEIQHGGLTVITVGGYTVIVVGIGIPTIPWDGHPSIMAGGLSMVLMGGCGLLVCLGPFMGDLAYDRRLLWLGSFYPRLLTIIAASVSLIRAVEFLSDSGLVWGMQYAFVSKRHFREDHVGRHGIKLESARDVYQNSTIINNYNVVNNNQVINEGISVEQLNIQNREELKPVRLQDVAGPEKTTLDAGSGRKGDVLPVYRPAMSKQTRWYQESCSIVSPSGLP